MHEAVPPHDSREPENGSESDEAYRQRRNAIRGMKRMERTFRKLVNGLDLVPDPELKEDDSYFLAEHELSCKEIEDIERQLREDDADGSL